MPTDQDLTDLRLSLRRPDGSRDLYLYDIEPDPDRPEGLMRYIGTRSGTGVTAQWLYVGDG